MHADARHTIELPMPEPAALDRQTRPLRIMMHDVGENMGWIGNTTETPAASMHGGG
jgi:hypothetical protein